MLIAPAVNGENKKNPLMAGFFVSVIQWVQHDAPARQPVLEGKSA
ncbi:hypothetical protein [Erwinia endophytica]|nr:hypothetical protein [Erwinia endophytica]